MTITVYLKPDGNSTFNPIGRPLPEHRVYIEVVHGLIDKDREPTFNWENDTITLRTTLKGSPPVIWTAQGLYLAAKDGNFGFRLSE